MWPHEARDAIDAVEALRRYAHEKLEGLDLDRLPPKHARAVHRYLEAPPLPKDFRTGILIAYERLEQLAVGLEDVEFLRRVLWSMDGFYQWLQRLYAYQQGEGSAKLATTSWLFVTFGEQGMGLLPATLRIGSNWTRWRLLRHLPPLYPAPVAWRLSQLASPHHQKRHADGLCTPQDEKW
jgi:hypothetical protein